MTDINFGTIFMCMTSTISHSTLSSLNLSKHCQVTAKPAG